LATLPFVPAALSQAGFPPLYELHVGGFGPEGTSSWPIYIAQEKGHFAREGLKVTFTRSLEKMAGLLGGSFGAINDTADPPILAESKGAGLVVVYDTIHKPPQFLALGRDVNTIAELKGKIVGVWKIPSTDEMLLKQSLTKNGISLDSVSVRMLGGSRDRFAALHAGQISATLLDIGFAQQAQQAGMKLIASPADWEVFPWNVIVFKRQWAANNSDVVVKYLRAVHQATRWLINPANFDEAVVILARIAKVDEKTMRWSLQTVNANKVYNLEKPTVPIFQRAADWLLAAGFLTKRFDAATIIDAAYYERAVK
jgi:ABC-type nitrate/sulfonate/bicarbonate transport system substrate-binding protein